MSAARQAAQVAADTIRASNAAPELAGVTMTAHLLLSRPRRGVWHKSWSNLPGLLYDCGAKTYTHALLPGWCYTAAEMRTEMLDDLERFAQTGELPTETTT